MRSRARVRSTPGTCRRAADDGEQIDSVSNWRAMPALAGAERGAESDLARGSLPRASSRPARLEQPASISIAPRRRVPTQMPAPVRQSCRRRGPVSSARTSAWRCGSDTRAELCDGRREFGFALRPRHAGPQPRVAITFCVSRLVSQVLPASICACIDIGTHTSGR